MSTPTQVPFELYKANAEFALRTNKLLKECGRRWLDTFDQEVDESISESQQEIDKLSVGEDWQSLAAIPGETFLRRMQQEVGDAQAIAQTAVTNQSKFLAGLQDALLIWQRETSKALGGAEGATSFNESLNDFFKMFANAAAGKTGHDR
ncbi:hypothetical protein B0E46_10845 [Rhodanobacter sp. B04]|uniref:hypothetical protein n=1 Tax=Rhodanobacter sp. B04 TaxID=1945860 RepID=UPI0009853FFD|nr:hypothetical protein [Rhodanobacter sp. B04]OOG63473.1 hypothetical protein B0E46_10845 [Rhodanobacter sp. B04]